jgi:hypothetical protein
MVGAGLAETVLVKAGRVAKNASAARVGEALLAVGGTAFQRVLRHTKFEKSRVCIQRTGTPLDQERPVGRVKSVTFGVHKRVRHHLYG